MTDYVSVTKIYFKSLISRDDATKNALILKRRDVAPRRKKIIPVRSPA
jgi:hypothetical protein